MESLLHQRTLDSLMCGPKRPGDRDSGDFKGLKKRRLSESDDEEPPDNLRFRDANCLTLKDYDEGETINVPAMAESCGTLSNLAKLKEVLETFSLQLKDNDGLTSNDIKNFVDLLYESSRPPSTQSPSSDGSVTAKENSGSPGLKAPADSWSCANCHGVLADPITLPCGHCCCRRCTLKEFESLRPSCGRCKARLKFSRSPFVRVNVLVNSLCKKFWKDELDSVDMRNDGNDFFKEGKLQEAISAYTTAIELNPKDHLVFGNRSHALLKAGDLQQALADADSAIRTKPDWPKGYFRRAMALQRLKKHPEAFIALYQCLILEEDNAKPIKTELIKILDEALVSRSSPNNSSDSSDSESRSSTSSPSASRLIKRKSKTYLRSSNFYDQLVSTAEELNRLALRTVTPRAIAASTVVSKDDFECPLCFRIFFKPVTTPCGHTFCKMCLDRILDHNTVCPMCKGSLVQYLAERREAVDDFVEESIKRFLPQDAQEREEMHRKEMEELAGASMENKNEVPVFVCTMSFPNIPCPLHVFEPRYRLMIRRCMEAGTREFGMCCYVDRQTPFAEYGTMLEIRDIQYFPDGRAVVDTVGGRRFKVLTRSMRDGYNTATVEFIKDNKLDLDRLDELQQLHESILQEARTWFHSMSPPIREGILRHYGEIPEVENSYWELPNGPSWMWWIVAILPLDPHGQLKILAQTDLRKRLEDLQRILRFLTRNSSNS